MNNRANIPDDNVNWETRAPITLRGVYQSHYKIEFSVEQSPTECGLTAISRV